MAAPVVHEEECMIGDGIGSWESRLDPDMLANAILQAMQPLPCVLLSLAPLHASLPLLLVCHPTPCVCVAAAIVHGALPMLQVVLPSTCIGSTAALDAHVILEHSNKTLVLAAALACTSC